MRRTHHHGDSLAPTPRVHAPGTTSLHRRTGGVSRPGVTPAPVAAGDGRALPRMPGSPANGPWANRAGAAGGRGVPCVLATGPHRRRPGNRGMRGGCLRLEGRARRFPRGPATGERVPARRVAAPGTKGRADGAPLPARGHCPMCCFSQALTVSCHCTLLCGLSTQWFSSGKYRNLDSMPLRCSAVKVARPCSTGMR